MSIRRRTSTGALDSRVADMALVESRALVLVLCLIDIDKQTGCRIPSEYTQIDVCVELRDINLHGSRKEKVPS